MIVKKNVHVTSQYSTGKPRKFWASVVAELSGQDTFPAIPSSCLGLHF